MPGARGLHRNYESISRFPPQARQQSPLPPPRRSRHQQTEAKWTVNLLVNAGKLASCQAGKLAREPGWPLSRVVSRLVATVPLSRSLTLTNFLDWLNWEVWHTLCYAPRIACQSSQPTGAGSRQGPPR